MLPMLSRSRSLTRTSIVTELVSRLVDASMLIRESTPDGTRFRMLETLREAGQEELVRRDLGQSARQRLVDHARSVADRVARGLL